MLEESWRRTVERLSSDWRREVISELISTAHILSSGTEGYLTAESWSHFEVNISHPQLLTSEDHLLFKCLA